MFYNNLLLEEKTQTLFPGLLLWKQKQNKKPDILKVTFAEHPRAFASPLTLSEFRISSFIWGKKRVFLLLLFRWFLYGKQAQKIFKRCTFRKSTQVVPVGLECSQGNVYFLKACCDDQPSLRPIDLHGLLARSDQNTYTTTSCCVTVCFCVPSDKHICTMGLFKGVCWKYQKGLALSLICVRTWPCGPDTWNWAAT